MQAITNDAVQSEATLARMKTALVGLSAEQIKATATTMGLSAAQTAAALATTNMTASEIAAELAARGFTKEVTIQALIFAGYSPEAAAAATANLTFAASETTATTATSGFSAALKGLWATMMANPILLVVAALAALVASIVIAKKIHEDYINGIKEGYDEANEKVQSLTDQYDANKEKIQELIDLKAKGSITEAQEAELSNLKAENEQLALQIQYYKDIQAAKAEVANTVIKNELGRKKYDGYEEYDTWYVQNDELHYTTEGRTVKQDAATYLQSTRDQIKRLSSEYENLRHEFARGEISYEEYISKSNALETQRSSILNRTNEAISDIQENVQYLDSDTAEYYQGLINDLMDVSNNFTEIANKGFSEAFSENISSKIDSTVDSLKEREQELLQIKREMQDAGKEVPDSISNELGEIYSKLNLLRNVPSLSELLGIKDDAAMGNIPLAEYTSQLEQFYAMLDQIGLSEDVIVQIKLMVDSDGLNDLQANVEQALTKLSLQLAHNSPIKASDILPDMKDRVNELFPTAPELQKFLDFLSTYKVQATDTFDSILNDYQVNVVSVADKISEAFTNAFNSVKTEASAVSKALEEQGANGNLSLDTYKELTAISSDYINCLTTENGALQLNAEAAQALTDKKIELEMAQIDLQKALDIEKWKTNAEAIKEYESRLDELSPAEKAELEALKANNLQLQDNVNQYNLMKAELQDLTSVYQNWLNAQKLGSSEDMYNSLQGAIKQINEALDSGKTGIGNYVYQAAVELMVPENMRGDVAEYMKKLERYFTEDATGLINFANDIKDVFFEATEDGFKLISGTTLDAVADYLELQPEIVESMFKALEMYPGNDFKFTMSVDVDPVTEQLNGVDEQISAIKDELSGLASFEDGSYTANFGVNQADVDELVAELRSLEGQRHDITVQLTGNALEMLSQISTEIESTKSKLDELSNFDELTGEYTAKIGVDQGEVDQYVARLEQLENQQYSITMSLDADTVQARLDEISEQIAEKKAELESITDIDAEGNIIVNVDADSARVEELQAEIAALENEQHQIGILTSMNGGADEKPVTDALQKIEDFKINDKQFVVTAIDHSTDVLNGIKNLLSSIHDKTVTVTTRHVDVNQRSSDGEADAYGTSSATGGKTLVGERGRELVVSDGRYYTVGEFGAEFVDLKPGDIVFNHEDTEKIFSGLSGAQGRALAQGNAADKGISGTLTIPTGGSTKSSSTSVSTSTVNAEADTVEVTASNVQLTGGVIGGVTGGVASQVTASSNNKDQEYLNAIYGKQPWINKGKSDTEELDEIDAALASRMNELERCMAQFATNALIIHPGEFGNYEPPYFYQGETIGAAYQVIKDIFESYDAQFTNMQGFTLYRSNHEFRDWVDEYNKLYEQVSESGMNYTPISLAASSSENEKTLFEQYYELYNHYLAMDQISKSDYAEWLAGAVPAAVKLNQIEADDINKYYEEVLSAIKEGMEEVRSLQENAIDLVQLDFDSALSREDFTATKQYADEIADRYKHLQETIHAQAEWYRSQGYSDTSDEVSELSKLWWDYRDEIIQVYTDMYDGIVSTHENAITLTENWLEQSIKNNDYQGIVKYTDDIISHYKQMQETIHAQAEWYRSQGYSDTSDEVSKLSDLWWDYYDEIAEASANAWQQVVDNANDAVDEIQGLYDTLKDAAQEYADSGFITIDTLQKICSWGIEYLAYLKDENGQLVINEDSIQKVIAARTEQMAVETALSYVAQIRSAIQRNELNELAQLTLATETTTSATWDLVYAQLKLLNVSGQLNDEMYDGALQNINNLRALSDIAVSSIGKVEGSISKALKKQSDALDDLLKYVEQMIRQEVRNQIKALEDQVDTMKELVDLQKKSLSLEKEKDEYTRKVADKEKDIADLRKQIAALDLDDSREAAAKKAKLQEELTDKINDLSDLQSDHAYDAASDMLDDMADAYKKEKQTEIDILENSISSEEKVYQLAIERIQTQWDTLYQDLINWNYEYGSVTNNEITSAWDAASAAVQQYGSYLEAVLQIQRQLSILESSSSFSSSSSSSSSSQTPSVVGKTGNYDTSGGAYSIVEKMKANSNKWWDLKAANDQVGLDNLEKDQQDLARQLREKLPGMNIERIDGTWYINGEELYKSKYATYHTGGVVGDDPSLKGNEVVAKLEKGETVLTKKHTNNLYQILDTQETMLAKYGKLLGSLGDADLFTPHLEKLMNQDAQQAQNIIQTGGDSYDITVPVQIYPVQSMSEQEIQRLTKDISKHTITELNDAFIKRGKHRTSNPLKP